MSRYDREPHYNDEIDADYNFNSIDGVRYNERIVDQWNKLIANEKVFDKLITLKREKNEAEKKILDKRDRISNSAILLFKLKDEFDFNQTKDFNKFQKKLEKSYQYKIMQNSSRDVVGLNNSRSESYVRGEHLLTDMLLENEVIGLKDEEKQISWHGTQTKTCKVIDGYIGGRKIKHNYSPRQYSNTDFTVWSITKGDSLNKTIQESSFITFKISNHCNMELNRELNTFHHPQTLLQTQLDKVKESDLVKNVIGEYYNLIDQNISDVLMQRNQSIDMFGSEEATLKVRLSANN